MDVINIASGYQPIVKSDLIDCPLFIDKVVNYDPLPETELSVRYLQIIRMIHLGRNGQEEDLFLARSPRELDNHCLRGNTDLVIAISPYGFSAINADIDEKIAQWGYVIIFGNASNKYLKPENLFSSNGIRQKYAPLSETDAIAGYVKRAIIKILNEYQSYTSNLEKATEISTLHAYQKSHV